MASHIERRKFLAALGGAVVTRPLAARAQQPAMPVIGVLYGGSSDTYGYLLTAIRRGLRESGFIEGRNVAIEYRWAEDRYDRVPALAEDHLLCSSSPLSPSPPAEHAKRRQHQAGQSCTGRWGERDCRPKKIGGVQETKQVNTHYVQ